MQNDWLEESCNDEDLKDEHIPVVQVTEEQKQSSEIKKEDEMFEDLSEKIRL